MDVTLKVSKSIRKIKRYNLILKVAVPLYKPVLYPLCSSILNS